MCAVSAVGDDYTYRIPNTHTFISQDWQLGGSLAPPPTRAEFDALKQTVEQMKGDLLAAKRRDQEAGAPDCEMEEKIALLRKVAELVGVDLNSVFGRP